MAEAAADIGRAAHLPEQPRQTLGACLGLGRQEGTEFLGEIHQDGAGLEHADRLRAAAIDESRDLGVGIDGDEAAAELVAVVDPDQPGVVFRALVAQREQFLQHHGDLHAVRRAERIELQRMAADRQFFFVRGAGDRTVDVCEPPLELACWSRLLAACTRKFRTCSTLQFCLEAAWLCRDGWRKPRCPRQSLERQADNACGSVRTRLTSSLLSACT